MPLQSWFNSQGIIEAAEDAGGIETWALEEVGRVWAVSGSGLGNDGGVNIFSTVTPPELEGTSP